MNAEEKVTYGMLRLNAELKHSKFLDECVYAKVGTIPMLVRLDKRCTIEVGKRIQWREREGQRHWNTGIIRSVEPLRIDRH